jgi:hypothetical protein
MGWKATGQASVRQQRGKWVVRLDGIDTETGKQRPRQLGTYPSQRAATAAAKEAIADGRPGPTRSTAGWLVRRWAASRTDVGPKSRLQYEWAAQHVDAGLGSIRLDREDVARWLDGLATDSQYARRSIMIFVRSSVVNAWPPVATGGTSVWPEHTLPMRWPASSGSTIRSRSSSSLALSPEAVARGSGPQRHRVAVRGPTTSSRSWSTRLAEQSARRDLSAGTLGA